MFLLLLLVVGLLVLQLLLLCLGHSLLDDVLVSALAHSPEPDVVDDEVAQEHSHDRVEDPREEQTRLVELKLLLLLQLLGEISVFKCQLEDC